MLYRCTSSHLAWYKSSAPANCACMKHPYTTLTSRASIISQAVHINIIIIISDHAVFFHSSHFHLLPTFSNFRQSVSINKEQTFISNMSIPHWLRWIWIVGKLKKKQKNTMDKVNRKLQAIGINSMSSRWQSITISEFVFCLQRFRYQYVCIMFLCAIKTISGGSWFLTYEYIAPV